jgi:hypothetical protein
MAEPAVSGDLAGVRRTLLAGALAGAAAAALIWLGVWWIVPVRSAGTLAERLFFGLGCCCWAVLLCFATGIEAVAHERLGSAAIDPLAGRETRRIRIDLRYLQHTLEQLLLFTPGTLLLAGLVRDLRIVIAITLVWIVMRFAFWLGYHRGAQYRAFGLFGMVQSVVVLLYACARFGYGAAGIAGAAAPVLSFALAEALLVWRARHPASGE